MFDVTVYPVVPSYHHCYPGMIQPLLRKPQTAALHAHVPSFALLFDTPVTPPPPPLTSAIAWTHAAAATVLLL